MTLPACVSELAWYVVRDGEDFPLHWATARRHGPDEWVVWNGRANGKHLRARGDAWVWESHVGPAGTVLPLMRYTLDEANALVPGILEARRQYAGRVAVEELRVVGGFMPDH